MYCNSKIFKKIQVDIVNIRLKITLKYGTIRSKRLATIVSCRKKRSITLHLTKIGKHECLNLTAKCLLVLIRHSYLLLRNTATSTLTL